MALTVHVERVGDTFTITTIIPPRRAGVGPNLGAMQKALNLLTALNPDAFDPPPVADPETPVAHHATDAPMPPHVAEIIARHDADDSPEESLNFQRPNPLGEDAE